MAARLCTICIVLLAFLFIAPSASAERRLALVIGNGAYAEGPLRNPLNDARAMAAALRELNFDVTLLENADRTKMQRAALEFGRKLSEDVVGLFYFAGHGMQVRGVNYLIPISAQVGSEEEIEVEALDVNYVLSRMATAKNRFNIVILDACRNNPFERSFRSSTAGLAAISAPRGTLIAYATAPGAVAADGQGANGLYTGELVAALKAPNLTLEQTFKNARAEVVTKSSGKQTPWESSSVIGDFIFRPQAAPPVVSTADATFWAAVKDSGNPSDYQAYLKSFPQGFYATLAQSRINILSAVRDTEISRITREAADRAAREALLQAQQREAEAAKASQDAQARARQAEAEAARAEAQARARQAEAEAQRVAQEAAERAKRAQLEAEKATREAEARVKAAQEKMAAAAPVQTASLSSAPVSTVGRQSPGVEMKSNWAAVERAVRAHFADPENAWFYSAQTQVNSLVTFKLNAVNYYEPVTANDAGNIEAVFLMNGVMPFPRNIYTGGFHPVTFYVKYALEKKADGYAVSEFLPVSAASVRPKDTGSDQSRGLQ